MEEEEEYLFSNLRFRNVRIRWSHVEKILVSHSDATSTAAKKKQASSTASDAQVGQVRGGIPAVAAESQG